MAVIIISPAPHGTTANAVVGESARMPRSRRKSNRSTHRRNVAYRGRTVHIVGVSVAKASTVTFSPTLEPATAVGENSTGVPSPDFDIDGHDGIVGCVSFGRKKSTVRRLPIECIVVAELTIVVQSPTLEATVEEASARVVLSARDLRNR